MTFLTPSLDGFIRWYMMFADHASIVSPSSLQNHYRAFVQKIADKI